MRLNSLMHSVMLRLFRLLTCREVERLSYDFLEGALDPRMARRIDRHLAACRVCQRFINSYRKTKEIGRVLPRPSLDPRFKKEILSFLIKERLS
jgi:putative zinc finger protein